MQYEPTEIELKSTSRRLAARRTARPQIKLHQPSIVDAAFDDYTRVDVASNGQVSTSSARSLTNELMSDIAAQLKLLDRQRAQLAALLREVTL